jgi:glycosyltransferase involved in cell wall biosynthesis
MIMVSVVMITYGHEKYIEDAINAVLNQQCNFEFELILSNDASPDYTHSIIQKLLSSHSKANVVKYTLHEKNLGMMGNSLYAMNLAKGKYISFCEGDDYWTDMNKLQIQVDFMEKNEDYVMSFHKVEITHINDSDKFYYPTPQCDTLYLKDIIREHYIPTCSLMYKNECFKNGYPKWLLKSISGDIPLEIMLSSKGKTKYLNKSMACYRRNEGGISQSMEQLAKMRSGYIFMYSKILMEIGVIRGYYLIYKLVRLIGGGIKYSVIHKFKSLNK